MKKNSLLNLQLSLSKAIKSDPKDLVDIENLKIKNQPPISILERLFIYQEAFKQRMLESFAEDFPRVKEILLEDEFYSLVFSYLKKYPSQYWSLGEVSKNFSLFIESSNLLLNYPFLAQLAELEWLKNLSYLAFDESCFNFEEIGKIPENLLGKLSLKLNKSVFFYQSSWDLEEKQNIYDNKEKYFCIIFKNKNNVIKKKISKKQYELLELISKNKTVEEITSQMEDINENDMTAWIHTWVSERIISEVTLKESIYEGKNVF